MSKKETKKQYWQRIAKEQGVKHQDNDTIGMLVTAIAAKLKIDADGISPSGLQKMVNKKLADNTTSKGKSWSKSGGSKKTEGDKLEEKKAEAVNEEKKEEKKEEGNPELGDTPPTENKVVLPAFNSIKEMKDFCVEKGLNMLDGYVSATKQKQVDFLAWIVDNASKIKQLPKNNIAAAKEIVGGFKETTPKATSEAPAEMVSYAKSIMGYINSSPALAIHKKFPKEELKDMLSKALKNYNYSVDNDGIGSYITMTDNNENSVRIPEQGYLPM
ncbi:MAG: hypothetical protein PHT69_02200 [Bacteroidales bacterium]|nr:hypothetical protein [Bacteroidales bacterium]